MPLAPLVLCVCTFLAPAALSGSGMAPAAAGLHDAEPPRPNPHPDRVKPNSDAIMDLITLAGAARADQAIDSRQEILVIHAATLSARRVRSIMVPAAEVKTFDSRKSLLENLRELGPRLHRSYPVSRDGSLENAEGSLRLRDLLVHDLLAGGGGAADWQAQVRPLQEIDGNAPVTELLTAFLENQEIAARVRRDGLPVGWITLDDVTETLLGTRG